MEFQLPENITPAELHEQFIDRIKRHDYSYHYSDDHRAYQNGQRSYDILTAQVKKLVTVHGFDAETLLAECIEARTEQYIDGLTHNVINGLFKNLK